MAERAVELALVAAGGFVGTLARAALLGGLGVTPPAVPWPTLLVYVSGALARAVLVRLSAGRRARLLLGTGVLGAWTTFSTLAVEADRLLVARPLAGVVYALVTVVAGLAAAQLARA